MKLKLLAPLMISAGCVLAPLTAAAQSGADTIKEIERYRAALVDGNPAELWEARGEDLWKKKAGPKNEIGRASCRERV